MEVCAYKIVGVMCTVPILTPMKKKKTYPHEQTWSVSSRMSKLALLVLVWLIGYAALVTWLI